MVYVVRTWITLVILELTHARDPDWFHLEGAYLLDTKPMQVGSASVVFPGSLVDGYWSTYHCCNE